MFRTDDLVVRKRMSPWGVYASWCGVDFEQLAELYRKTAEQQGLVHAVGGSPTVENGVYSVDLIPVGLPSSNVTLEAEDDVRQLLHGLLHGLVAIHEVG